MLLSWLFFFLSVHWLHVALNALYPVRGFRLLVIPSWIYGWLVTEAPLHWLAGEALITAAFLSEGPFRRPIGWLGLALATVNWAILLFLYRKGQTANLVLEEALDRALPAHRQLLRQGCAADGRFSRMRLCTPWLHGDRGVRRVKHLRYAPGGRRQTLDVYAPKVPVQGAPVLVQIHGGFWAMGHKGQQAQPLLYYMAARGWICVSINYSLSPWKRWPAHLLDAKRALVWVKRHIAEYGGDPHFVVCTGGSAGGHLTSLLALTPNRPELQPEHPEVDTRIQGAVPFYAVYDFCNTERQHRHGGLRMMLEWLVVGKRFSKHEALYRAASPLLQVNEQAPPFFVVHGKNDSLACVEEARLFVSRLSRVSREPVAYAELPYAQHAFEVFHSPRTWHVVHATHRFCEAMYARHLAQRARDSSPALAS